MASFSFVVFASSFASLSGVQSLGEEGVIESGGGVRARSDSLGYLCTELVQGGLARLGPFVVKKATVARHCVDIFFGMRKAR